LRLQPAAALAVEEEEDDVEHDPNKEAEFGRAVDTLPHRRDQEIGLAVPSPKTEESDRPEDRSQPFRHKLIPADAPDTLDDEKGPRHAQDGVGCLVPERKTKDSDQPEAERKQESIRAGKGESALVHKLISADAPDPQNDEKGRRNFQDVVGFELGVAEEACSPEVISGCTRKKSSEAIRGHQRSSEVISGP
jgi:hypothetical protein